MTKNTNETPEASKASNVFEALAEIYAKVGYVQKQASPELRYTYAGANAFIAAIRPAMVCAGLIVYPSDMELIEAETYTTTRSGATMNINRIRATYTFHHAPSDTKVEVVALGEGADIGDKAMNKAMTAAMKYAVRQALYIATGDDPDDTPSEEQARALHYPGKKGWTEEKIAEIRPALEKAMIIPPDAHPKHFTALLDLSPFGNEAPVKDLIGWGKIYRGAKDAGANTADAVAIASKGWLDPQTSDDKPEPETPIEEPLPF